MSKTRKPYVGVTGFMSPHELGFVLTDDVKAALMRANRLLMNGVLVSEKSLRGEPVKPKWRWQYPEPSRVAGLFRDSRCLLNLVHYNTKQEAFCDELLSVQDLAGPWCDGFQLNMAWPTADELRRWRMHDNHGQRLVLQIGKAAFDAVGRDAQALVMRLHGYVEDGLITDVLFDLSGGDGVALDRSAAVPVLERLYDVFGQWIGIGAAGGLGPGSAGTMAALFKTVPSLSIDAQGQLRTKPIAENAAGGDDLDTNKARAYVLEALALCP